MAVTFHHFDSTDWVDELAAGKVDRDLALAARAAGARRKMLAAGESGLYVQYSEFPPGYRIDPHTHSHGEVIMVLAGSCTVDGGEVMRPNDAVCIEAGTSYGITCGPAGMTMLTIRAGDAVVSFGDA
jgi:quercetin dioxygenase-like cupin family protein